MEIVPWLQRQENGGMSDDDAKREWSRALMSPSVRFLDAVDTIVSVSSIAIPTMRLRGRTRLTSPVSLAFTSCTVTKVVHTLRMALERSSCRE